MLVGEPWERVAIDITGKNHKSRNGDEYVNCHGSLQYVGEGLSAQGSQDAGSREGHGGATVQSSRYAISAAQRPGP